MSFQCPSYLAKKNEIGNIPTDSSSYKTKLLEIKSKYPCWKEEEKNNNTHRVLKLSEESSGSFKLFKLMSKKLPCQEK